MCKHKSGGMSKATGTTSHHGVSERAPASISSQDCTTVEPLQDSSSPVVPSNSSISLPSRKQSSASNCNSSSTSCDTYSYLPDNNNPPCVSNYENFSYMLNTQQRFLEPQDSDEEETEQSPMLLKDPCAIYSDASESWNPNVLTDNIAPPIQFSNTAKLYCSGIEQTDLASNCDNFAMYHNNFPPQSVYQEPVPMAYHGTVTCPSYFESTINNFDEHMVPDLSMHTCAPKHKKKWMLNNKCKSADSEPETFNRYRAPGFQRGLQPIGYNYVQSTNVLETHIDPYNKPMYSANGDPIAGPSGLQRPYSINWEMGINNTDSEFRSRSYSLTPTVNFAVFESESSSEAEDTQEPIASEPVDLPAINEKTIKTLDDPFELPVMTLGKVIPISPSAAQLSIASSYGDNGSPICKICHMTARENDPLISPCRCSGTMQYIHCGCLMRWLEVCHKRGRRPASCELCQYQYHWHKKFKVRHWQMPQCSRKDKVLHLLFIFSLLLMVTCACLTIMFFKHDKGTKVDLNQELTQSEIGNLVCGVLFFVAFFVAIYVEAKSHDTLYKLLVKFIHINQQWYIDEYEKKETPPVAV